MILHYGKRSLFWSVIIFGYLSFTTGRGQKIGFNRCESTKFLNIANIHALDVWWKRMFVCNNKIFFLCVYSFCNATLFHSGYVIKPPQPSSAICGAPPFTGHLTDTLPSVCASLAKSMVHCICTCDTQLWHFVLVTILPTGQSRVIKKFSSRSQSKTSWPRMK